MPKISSTNNTSIIIKYLARVIITTAATLFLFNLLISYIILKLDISLEYAKYFEFGTVILTSLTVSFVSMLGFKQNYMLLSMISVVPLLLYSFINFLINNTDFKMFLAKIILIVILSAFLALIKSIKRNRR